MTALVEEEFGSQANVHVRSFRISEVLLDWDLVRYALENAMSNARKYGTGKSIEIAIEYMEPNLFVQVTNQADPKAQSVLMARHGSDATSLLHSRGDARGIHSTNLGGQVMRRVANLLNGSVSLHLATTASRLCFRVNAPRAIGLEVTEPLLVYFIDDEPTMRMVYNSWIRSPSPLHGDSRVFPPSHLTPEDTDEVMRRFATQVLMAQPRPGAVCLDQNLRSQVIRRENATRGTDLAMALRSGGYKGVIIIRSANVSSTVMKEYLAAGADAVMHKDESRER